MLAVLEPAQARGGDRRQSAGSRRPLVCRFTLAGFLARRLVADVRPARDPAAVVRFNRGSLHAAALSQAIFLVLRGEAYVLANRLEDAFEVSGRALAFTREGGQRPNEARALRLLGEVTARRDSPDRAEGHYREARALAEQLGMRPLAAHCHLGLGKLYRRTGTQKRGDEHLTTATTMYRDMGMTYWLERAEAKIRQL
jgi:tetratricopeptide (TPR) repeat protein